VTIIEDRTTKYTKLSEEIEYINANENNKPIMLVKPLHFFEEWVDERF
tara:strand:- start:91 stop:234 length:144 start_codon:yes stop_codon:yes gene_type:complete